MTSITPMRFAERITKQAADKTRTPFTPSRGFGHAAPAYGSGAGHSFSQMRVYPDVRALAFAENAAFRAGELSSEPAPAISQGAVPRQLQRYNVPGALACNEVVPWLTGNSPYAPEWAETRCNYSFGGQARLSSKAADGGGVVMTATGHPGLSASVKCPIDRPQWSPSARPNRSAEVAAWNGMRATLDAHEEQHRNIGQTWRGILEQRWQGVNLTATGRDMTDAKQQIVSQLQAMQQQGQADAQAAQDQIDPFRGAVLICP